MNVQEKFKEIFKNQTWKGGESVSGTGSDYEQTIALSNYIYFLIVGENIKSMVDFPCGDFNWMSDIKQHIDESDGVEVSYKGIDIVPELIEANKEKYPDVDFSVGNIITDEIPECDFLMVRDCFVHLKNDMIFEALANILRSNVVWVGITSFVGRGEINDLTNDEWDNLSAWRPVDLMAEPFNLPCPTYIFIEQCNEADGEYSDKSLSVWNVEKLRDWAAEYGFDWE